AGRAKILDFGLAKEVASAGTDQDLTFSAPGTVLGTAYAMSPEQALGRDLDGRSDLFSLGALLYELSTGAPPFPAHSPTASPPPLPRGLAARPALPDPGPSAAAPPAGAPRGSPGSLRPRRTPPGEGAGRPSGQRARGGQDPDRPRGGRRGSRRRAARGPPIGA